MNQRALTGSAVSIVAVVAIALVAIRVTTAEGQDTAQPDAAPRTITVSSSATIDTTPDEAVITFNVRSEDAVSTTALNESSRIMNELIAAMKSLQITERDMGTQHISVSPHTIDRGTPSESTVYASSTSLDVTIRDFDVIGPAIEKGVKAGATSVRGVKFQVSDAVEVHKRALRSAVESARAKADALASAAGTSVTGVVRIREGGSPAAPMPYVARNQAYAAFDAALTVVPPRDITTKVSVSVIWSVG